MIFRTIIWTTCALSGLPLVAPVVADAPGQLFNKQAVLEHLLAARAAAAAAGGADTAAAGAAAPLALPAAAGAPVAGGSTAALVRSSTSADGAIIPFTAAARAAAALQPPKELAAACLRYENQQRAAAAASAAGGDAATAAQGTFEHIKSLKDVFVVQLTPNPDAGGTLASAAAAVDSAAPQSLHVPGHSNSQHASSANNGSSSDLPSPWMCPVTLQLCGSKQPCCAIRPCGHVLSQKALAAIAPLKGGAAAGDGKSARHHSRSSSSSRTAGRPADGSLAVGEVAELESASDCCCCPVCEVPFDASRDVVLIGGSQQHMDSVRAQLQEAAAAKALSKQQKKRKRATAAVAAGPQ